jgi:hypothetical protein
MPGENLDLSSDARPPAEPRGKVDRRFLGVHFACCDVYNRIYLNSDGTAYQGYCPRCSKRITVHIGPGGSDSRFFTAY